MFQPLIGILKSQKFIRQKPMPVVFDFHLIVLHADLRKVVFGNDKRYLSYPVLL